MAVTRAKGGKSKRQEDSSAPPAKKARTGKDASTSVTLLKALLSDKAYALAYPPIDKGHGEVDWDASARRKPLPDSKAGKTRDAKPPGSTSSDISTGKPRGYSSTDLSPFEELLCAVMLSKPLSHRLGLRAIATLLSPPYAFTTVEALANAGEEGRRAALYEARTQHKDKTATQLGDVAAGLKSLCGDDNDDQNALRAVCEAVQKCDSQQAAINAVHTHLIDNIKGLGPTGAAIFLRRIQAHHGWHKVFPYIDQRTADTANQLGLLDGAKADKAGQQLADMLDGNDDKKRRDFVRLLDVLVGLGFQKDIDAVKQQILTNEA